MPDVIRNRIKSHRRVRAGGLVPHEYNFRRHPAGQQPALRALYAEVGFARSLLAYELPNGRLKLIDGHLRRDLDPDMEVDLEALDVDDAEAWKLLLSIDPLAALAENQIEVDRKLREMTPTASAELTAAWERTREQGWRALAEGADAGRALPEQWLVLVTCRDEGEQARHRHAQRLPRPGRCQQGPGNPPGPLQALEDRPQVRLLHRLPAPPEQV
jgi:hypothetical protein